MMNSRFVLILTLFAAPVVAQVPRTPPRIDLWPTGTFSILAFDPATGEIGGAVQSRVFSVGNGVLWAEAGVGAAATQAGVGGGAGPPGRGVVRRGRTAEGGGEALWGREPCPPA